MQTNIIKNLLCVSLIAASALAPRFSVIASPLDEVKDYGYNFHEVNNVTPDIPTLTTDLFGDAIDPASGSIAFSQTDISIPGNSGLPVAITRTLSDPDSWFRETRDFENWSLSIPHVRSTYVTDLAGDPKGAYWAIGKACTSRLNSNPSFSKVVISDIDFDENATADFESQSYVGNKDTYWNGDTVSIPGRGSVKLTEKSGSYKRHNNRNWNVECITNSDGSEGFKITTNDGVKYYFQQQKVVRSLKDFNMAPVVDTIQCGSYYNPCFDEMVGFSDAPEEAQLPQYFIFMLATKVEDRFGNYVSYVYNSAGNLQKITSNDSRTININYSGGRISSITAQGKTWSYAYDDYRVNTLKSVTRPDNKQWTYSYDKSSTNSLWILYNIGSHSQIPYHGYQCIEGGERDFIEITHPEGMLGNFVLDEVCHGKSNVPELKRPNPQRRNYDTYWIAKVDSLYSISKKTLTQTNGEVYEWLYDYSDNEGHYRGEALAAKHRLSLNVSGVETAHLKSTTITNPDLTQTIQYFDREHGNGAGNLMYSEVYNSLGALQQRTKYEYKDGFDHGSALMYTDIQFSAVDFTEDDIDKGKSASQNQLMTDKVLTLFPSSGGSNTYTTTYSDFDDYDFNKLTHEYNSFNGKHRYIRQSYLHELSNHLIGLPTTTEVSSNGTAYTQVARTTYHSATGSYKSLPNYHYDHGRWYKRNTSYHTTGVNAGLPNRVTYNGTNRWVYFSNYKRGKAQTIRTPKSLSTASQYAYLVVNDDGQVTKVTDFEGHCTNYGYTTMGRLSLIDPCDNRWDDTIISYSTTTGNEGLSYVYADMLKQTITRGNYEKVSYFDSLLRNRLTKEWDKTNSSTKRYVRNDYDAFNRPTYQSLPSTSSTTSYGTNTEYDALGRTSVVDDNTTTGTVSYTYLANNKVRVNDNKGNQTTTTYLAYGSPTQQLATYIAAPESTNTTLNYNIYGNITSIAQGGITEHRVYDGYQKLCKTTRPDVGNTAMVYNALNQVTWTAQGSSISNSTTSCDTSVTAADKATYAYDNLGNVKSITFSDASPDQTYTYDKNSKLTKLVAGNVTTDYEYNDAGLLEKEILSVDSEAFTLDYVFNRNGHLDKLIYPSNAHITYAPNALGQSTKVSSYASAATYHANGAIKTHQYGNGATYSLTQNSSGLPSSTYDKSTVVECSVCLSSLATMSNAITDVRTKKVIIEPVLPGPSPVPDPELPPRPVTTYLINQSFTYDANNNLTFWDNKHTSSHDFQATYDGLDRLDVITDSYSGTGYFNYDSMGNITNYKIGNKTLTYTYNSNKQLTKVNGFQAKDFTYDSKGNVTNNGENTFGYNTANQMVSSSDGTYVYDGNNKRVKKVDGQGTSYSMYSNAGQLVYRKVNGVHTDYYYLGKKLVAKKKGSTKTYVHTDFLGSPAAESNTLGNVTSRLHYQPFGDTIEVAREDVGYTGHKFDKDLGLSYMQARYYDPVVGRFMSNDPVGFRDVHSFNRYAYANNNPHKFTDPTGMCPNCITGAIGAGVGGVFALISSFATEAANGFQEGSAGRILKATGKGVIVGGVTGFTGNPALGTATAAGLGAIDGGLTKASQEGSTTGDIVNSAITGAVVDGITTFAGGKAGELVGADTLLRQALKSEAVGTLTGTAVGASLQAGINSAPGVVEDLGNKLKEIGNEISQGMKTFKDSIKGIELDGLN